MYSSRNSSLVVTILSHTACTYFHALSYEKKVSAEIQATLHRLCSGRVVLPSSRNVSTVRRFNSRTTQLVLGARAIHFAATLKSINAKHYALVTQCIGVVLAILSHVRAALMAQLPNKQYGLLS